MRAFFALPLPETTRRSLGTLPADVGKARWVAEAQLHVTMRFLGEVDEATVAQVIATVEAHSTAMPWPAPHLSIGPLGIFGSPRKPRVIFAAVSPPALVRDLASRLDRALEEACFAPEERPFVPHVTLARLNRPDPDRVATLLHDQATFRTPSFHVPELVLYESTLESTGAIHTPVHRFSLGR